MHPRTSIFVAALCVFPSLGSAGDTWDLIGPYGGWINDLHRDGSGRILAATAFGGIYRSSDDAESWQQIYDGDFNIDPRSVTTNASGHIFVGADGFEGNGFLRSTDDGATWQVLSNALSSRLVIDLLVAPDQSIYACTSQGLFRSTNGGTTFTQVPGLPSFTSRIEADADGDLFLGVQFTTANLFRSIDDGATWQQSDIGIGFDVLDIHASGSGLYAVGGNAVYRSTNDGTSWTSVNAPPEFSYTSVTVATNGDICASFYGGTELGGRIYRTTNGGASWAQDSGLSGHAVDRLLSTPEGSLFVGSKGPGVYRYSSNGTADGGDWQQKLAGDGGGWEQKVAGMCNTWIVDIADDPITGMLYVATQHTLLLRSSDGGASWQNASKGISVHETPTGLAVNSEGSVYLSTYQGVYKSTDQGDDWTSVLESTTVTAINCNAQDDVFAGSGDRMYRSTDGGSNWTVASLMSVQNIADIAFDVATVYAACGTPGGFGSRGVYRSTDNGSTFAAFNSGLTDLNVTCIAVGAPDGGSAAPTSCRITLGTKGSGTWNLDGEDWSQDPVEPAGLVADIDKRIVSDALKQLRVDRKRVMRRPNPSTCDWQSLGVPSTPKADFRKCRHVKHRRFAGGGSGEPEVGYLIGTVGYGIFQQTPDIPTDVPQSATFPRSVLVQNDPNPFERRTVIEFEVGSAGIVTLAVFDAAGREVAELVDGWKDAGRHTVSWDATGLTSGVYFSRLSTAGSEQSRRLVLIR